MKSYLINGLCATLVMAFTQKTSAPNPPLIDGPARGVSFLHAMQPKAAAQTSVLIDILRHVRCKNIAANFLVDNSFGWDPGLPMRIMDVLPDRRLTLIFYLYNGPSQRKYKSTPIRGFYTTTEPGVFREKIVKDAGLRNEYRALVKRLDPIIRRLKARGGRVIFEIGLEDNLTKREADSLKKIIRSVYPDAEIARNPCRACYPGDDGDTSGYIRERHCDSADKLEPGSVVTNDGSRDDLEKLVGLRKLAYSSDTIFIYWNAAAQGLEPGAPRKAPADRDYHIYTTAEQARIIRFLNQIP